MDKYVAFIPVRGGSKSIPYKNINPINGRPLVYWVIDAAVNCSLIDKVYISTDSDKIKDAVRNHEAWRDEGSKLLLADRDPETATDTATTESAMLDFANKHDFQNMVLIQATSPLLTSVHLTEGIKDFERNGFDSLLSVVEQKRFIWEKHGDSFTATNYDYRNRPRRQEFNGYYVENGAFYITGKEALLNTGCRLSGRIGAYQMPESTYFEIDEPDDWIVIEQLLKNTQNESRPDAKPKDIKLFATDCDGILTDAGMYYSESGDELKKFNTLDGMGISLMRKAGIKTAIITSEDTQIVTNRGKKLKIDDVRQGVKNKLQVLKELAEKYKLNRDEIAYMGDDINDIECLDYAGLSITVPNAVDEVKQHADHIVKKSGGSGAVREAADKFILKK